MVLPNVRTKGPTRFSTAGPVALLLLVTAALGGCKFAPSDMKWPTDFFTKKKEPTIPTRMMVIWSDTILHQPQLPGVRGFGGRIYFYEGNDPTPVVVDGGLAVYAFDADHAVPESAKPERKFVITADQFAEHMSHTAMGASYSVWLPWDEVGGVTRQLSLITRFEGRNGGVVISDPTIKLLPGLSEPLKEPSPIAPVAYVAAQSERAEKGTRQEELAQGKRSPEFAQRRLRDPRRETETIDLPPSFYRHLRTGSDANLSTESGEPAQTEPRPPEARAPEARASETRAPEASEEGAEPASQSPATDLIDRYRQQATRSTSPWARYPFRTTAGDPGTAQRHNRQQPIPAGWLQQLPETPRHGYPNGSADGERLRR